jgi:hypothetical protein
MKERKQQVWSLIKCASHFSPYHVVFVLDRITTIALETNNMGINSIVDIQRTSW